MSGMPAFHESTLVGASAEQAFDYLTDQSKVAEWNEHVRSVDVVGDGPIGPGSVLRQHRRRGEKDFDLTFEVVQHDRPRRHVVTGTVWGIDTTMAFDVAPEAGGTRVTQSAEVRGRGPRALLAPLIAREMRRSVRSGLAELTGRLGRP